MPRIKLHTSIEADISICFDLARSIDLHKISTVQTNEKAIAGITEGLISLNEYVTWEATHFGIRQTLTSKITAFEKPNYFRDEQVKGAFTFFIHDHYFQQKGNITTMTDIFNFESPLGFLGSIFNKIILTHYMTKLLTDRNEVIKKYAENGGWKSVITL